MHKYTPSDFMPKENVGGAETNETPLEEAGTAEVFVAEETSDGDTAAAEEKAADPERGAVSDFEGHKPDWAKYVSAFFSPILISTYCVALAMWITPLSGINENTRLVVTLIFFMITAIAPATYKLTVARLSKPTEQSVTPARHIVPGIVQIVCLAMGTYYLWAVHAPEWLVMIPFTGAVVTAIFIVAAFLYTLSSHTCGMGAMTAVLFYLGHHRFMDVTPTPWVAAVIILAGLAASAQVALERRTTAVLVKGFVTGLVSAYAIMHLQIFNTAY